MTQLKKVESEVEIKMELEGLSVSESWTTHVRPTPPFFL